MVGADGTAWTADAKYTGGALLYTSETISNTSDVQLYRSGRYSLYGDFSYTIPVANGAYLVTLKFAELQYTRKGERVFDVLVNGSKVLPKFDIIVAATATKTAVDRVIPVRVTDGKIQIDFDGIMRKGLVNAIQVAPDLAQSVGVAVSPTSATLTANQTKQFTASVSGASNQAVTWSVSGASPAGTVSPTGLYTAPSSIPQTSVVTVKATSAADSTKSASAQVTLQSPISVTLSPGSANVTSGNGVQFTSSVSGTSDSRVTWSANGGSISSTGYFSAPVVSSPTSFSVTAKCVADASRSASAQVTVSPVSSGGTGAFMESGGAVTMEAESGLVVQRAASWILRSDLSGFAGAGFVSAEPNVNVNQGSGYVGVSPEVQFPVRFATPGTYYVWIRGYGQTDEDDSVHVGLDGNAVVTGEMISEFQLKPSAWDWSNVAMDRVRRATLVIPSAGVHTINVWMREDGFRFDKMLLTTDSNLTPTGNGPAESPRDNSPASLNVSPANLSFSASAGASNPASQNVSIINQGGGTMNWTASSNQSWLLVSPASGTGSTAVPVSINIAGLAVGTYSGAITISAPGVTGSPKTVAVSLTISQTVTQPGLQASPASMSFSAVGGDASPGTQSLTIGNSGGGTLSWSLSKSQSWITLAQTSGSGSATVAVGANTSGMAVGNYSGQVTISATGATGSPTTLNVSLAVTQGAQAPTLQISPLSLSYSAVSGGSNPATQTVNISNTGGGTLNWTLSKTQSWLSLSQISGSGPAAISVSPSITGLAVGTYNDVITVTAPGAGSSPNYVNVSLTVSAAVPITGSGNQFYVATTGRSNGDGSLSRPWDIVTALAQPSAVRPGDTIWVRGGTYGTGQVVFQSRLLGTPDKPIIVRQYPGERSIINGWLMVGCCDQNPQPSMGGYVWFWGLEFASSITDRTGNPGGPPSYGSSNIYNAIDSWAPGSRFINNIIHDTRQGISWWKEAVDGEAYGNIIYNNGFQASDRGHGHGVYTQNNNGVKKITDNIVFNQFALGLQLYGSGDVAYVRNYDVQGNVAFNNGVISSGWPEGQRADNFLVAGGIDGAKGISLKNNYFYHDPEAVQGQNSMGWQWSNMNADFVATNNYFIGGGYAVDAYAWNSMRFTGNTVYGKQYTTIMQSRGVPFSSQTWNQNSYFGAGRYQLDGIDMDFSRWKAATGFDSSSQYKSGAPTGVTTFVRPNTYERGRAHIVIFNWDLRSSVAVDLSSAVTPGTRFEIRDAQNFFANPVVTGTYAGGTVNIPMTGLTAASPNGTVPNQPPHTAPQFGTFVVLSK